ncbi:MAG: molybdopterin-guanine dinucleotide biosynthesis protein B [Proteobacteria bacterium]|nr:MAG: molybdopterin-guanine dinucleotide biosynthesis protein B [Pseudomonadota bacterium]
MSKNPKRATYHFHPLEISFVGFSNTGKTTLVTRLIQAMSNKKRLAYVKSDAHRFEVDYPGKDSFRATEAGAQSSYISNAEHFAWMGNGQLPLFSQKSIFLDYDALFIEGHKALNIDKFVLLDGAQEIFDTLPEDSLASTLAFIGETEAPIHALPIDRPYFQRDAIAEIADFIEAHWQKKIMARPLHALVLAGGLSSRMGQDKGHIRYSGKAQAIKAFESLEELGLPSFISLREDQWSAEERADYPLIYDQFRNLGPLGGILTAMSQAPDAAWLVIACDLPLLSQETLENLLQRRNPFKLATAYRSTTDQLPEPLCAIYEPAIRMRLFEALGLGLSCPRKVLINSNSEILEPFDQISLTNANTPDDYKAIMSQIEEARL